MIEYLYLAILSVRSTVSAFVDDLDMMIFGPLAVAAVILIVFLIARRA